MGSVNSPVGQYVLGAVMTVLSTLALVARLYARRIRDVGLGWDDWFMFAAWIFTIGQCVGIWIGVAIGDIGQHADLNTPDGLPAITPSLTRFYMILFANFLSATLAIGLAKVSVILLYRRTFQVVIATTWFKLLTFSALALAIGWTIAFFFLTLFNCTPVNYNWVGYGGDNEHCLPTLVFTTQSWTDVIIDAFILMIPIPCILSVPFPMPWNQKLVVFLMFMIGGLTVAISITKSVYYELIGTILKHWGSDFTYYLTPYAYWPMVESAIGVVAGCLPCFKPIADKHLPKSFTFHSRVNVTKQQITGVSRNDIEKASPGVIIAEIVKSR